jgi:CBS domain-containing protein
MAYMRLHQVARAPVVDGDLLVGAVWLGDLEVANETRRTERRARSARSARPRSVA